MPRDLEVRKLEFCKSWGFIYVRFLKAGIMEAGKDKKTYDFLGFTFINGVSRKGGYQIIRRTSKKKWVPNSKKSMNG